MPTQFILGRAASGKTKFCMERIIAEVKADPLGSPIYYIVPKQATFLVQRRLAVGGELPGFCRIRVISFDKLASDLLTELAGDATPEVSPRGRRLILTHVLRILSPQLSVYQPAATRIGLASELDRTLSEIDRNGIDEHQLQSLIEQLAAEDPPADSSQAQLILKLRDLLLIQNAYSTFLGQDRIDPQRRLAAIAAAAEHSRALAGSLVFVDGHLDYTRVECQLLAAIASRCRSLTITGLVDPKSPVARDVNNLPDELSLFHRTETAYRRLHFCLKEAGVAIAEPERLGTTAVERPAVLRHLEAHWEAAESEQMIDDSRRVRVVAAPSRRSEVEAAAVVIREWLRDGLRPREVLVVSRRATEYADVIVSTFTEFGLPFFSDRRRSATHHPLLQVVRAIVQAWRNAFPHDAMMVIAKSGCCGISHHEADRVENFILEHNLLGSAWISASPWVFSPRSDGEPAIGRRPTTRDNFEAVRERLGGPIRAMLSACPPTGSRLPIRKYVAALLGAIEGYGTPAVLAQWIETAEAAEQFERAAEHQQVWAELIELFDELVELLGDDTLTAAEFEELLEASLAELELAIVPAAIDQVMVGEIERTRFEHYRGVIAIGWNDGIFPHATEETIVLGDADRASLSKTPLEFDPDTSRRLLNEPLLAYLAITRAAERLAVTYHEADEAARPIGPSRFVQQLTGLINWGIEGGLAPERLDLSLATPRTAVDCLARWARHPAAAHECDTAEVYAAVTTVAPLPQPLERLLSLAWPALSYDNRAALSAEALASLYSEGLSTSVSRIESFAACPFKHFSAYSLRLRARVEPKLNVADLGTLYHTVLESVVEEQIQSGAPWNPSSPPALAQVKVAAEQAAQSLRGSIMLSSAQHRQLLNRTETRLAEVLRHIHTAGAAGSMLPLAAELVFGDEGDLPPLVVTTPKQRTVRLSGKIDRIDHAVDHTSDAGSALLAVYDYKSSERALQLYEVYHGLSLQLLTYLIMLEANGGALIEKSVEGIGAFFVAIMRGLQSVDHPSSAADSTSLDFALRSQPRGLFDLRRAHLFDRALTPGIKSKVIKLHLTKDGPPNATGCDSAEHHHFRGVLTFVRDKIAAIADEIIDGVIEVHPYRIGTTTPCAHCEFRPLCRFEPTINRYNRLNRLKREAALAAMAGDIT